MVKKEYNSFIVFGLIFFSVKVSTFLAPLILSNLLSDQTDYGLFEYVLNNGLLLATPLSLGMHGSYPFFNLKLKCDGYVGIYFAHVLYVISILIISTLLYSLSVISEYLLYSFIVAGVYALQMLLSVMLKSHTKIKSAVLVEGGLFFVLNFFNIFLYLKFGLEISSLFFLISLYLLGLIIFFLCKYYQYQDFRFEKYVDAVKFGLKLVISGFLILLISGSTRIYIEYLLTLSDVGVFAFYFRLGAAVVMIHQIVNIAFFKKIYQANPKVLDKYFSLFLLLIFCVSLLVFFIAPIVLSDIFDMLDNYAAHRQLFFIIIFQVSMWISLALNENIIYREDLAGKMNILFLSLIIIFFIISLIADNLIEFNLNQVVILNMVLIFLATECQFYVLKSKKDISFKKTRIINFSLICIFFLSYNII